jgi:hypothetical protein
MSHLPFALSEVKPRPDAPAYSGQVKTAAIIVLAVAVLAAAVPVWGAWRWERATDDLRTRLEVARLPVLPDHVDEHELDALPPPVQRYFRAVLSGGQAIVAAASVEHAGTFDMSETQAKWSAFTSTQRVVTRRPGFDWDARIAMLPGVEVRVHDAYVAGEGMLHASLLGVITLADLRGTPEAAQGELMRFLAEAVWVPTALLPSQGVRWEAVSDRSAKASLTDGATTVSLLFSFDAEGLIDTVRAEARARTVGGSTVGTPWQGRYWNYERRDGMRVPLEGEVAWLPPEGPKPYWRGRIVKLAYEFAR